MSLTAKNYPQIAPRPATPTWEEALAYFKSRGSVVFLSYCRFWEPHAFVQQSLAKLLVQNGVRVEWMDGEHWKSYQPTIYQPSPDLKVAQRFTLPGRRWGLIHSLDKKWFGMSFRSKLKKLGGNPLVWIQAGFRENLVETIPYVDVFSTFDDPFYFASDSLSLAKARVVHAQNSFTQANIFPGLPKAQVVPPPVDMTIALEGTKEYQFPERFPKKVMGYIGSFFEEDYDLELFEFMVRTLPEWGFLLAGRSSAAGLAKAESLKRYPNFHYVPWAPREEILSLWKKLSVTLLLHRPRRVQYGAFPTKILESTYFGVPCVGTKTPKTTDIEKYFPMSSFPTEIRRLAVETSLMDKGRIKAIYDELSQNSDPRKQLIDVAAALMR